MPIPPIPKKGNLTLFHSAMPRKPAKKATASPKTTKKAVPKNQVNQNIEATSSNKGKAPLEDHQDWSDKVPLDIVSEFAIEDVDVENVCKYS